MSYRVKVPKLTGFAQLLIINLKQIGARRCLDSDYEMPRLGLLSQSGILRQDHNGGYSPTCLPFSYSRLAISFSFFFGHTL